VRFPVILPVVIVMAVPITFSVLATPVRPEPSPKKDVALTTPTTFNLVVGWVLAIPTKLLVLSALSVFVLASLPRLRALVIL